MRRVLALSLLATVTAFAHSAAKSPSLSETLEWMKSTLGPKGLVEWDRNGYNKYEAVPGKTSYTEVIKSFSYEDCRVKVVKETSTVDPLIGGDYMAQYTDEFNLSDFDPTSVDTQSGDGVLKGHVVTFSTTNDKKLIRCSSVTLNGNDAVNRRLASPPRMIPSSCASRLRTTHSDSPKPCAMQSSCVAASDQHFECGSR